MGNYIPYLRPEDDQTSHVQFRNLVFEGGGVKGLAYAGATRVLEERGILKDIQRVAGASAGAINALLMALGYNSDEQLEILKSTDFDEFCDGTWGYISDIYRLVEDFGWYKGEAFSKWLEGLIENKLGNSQATFADLGTLSTPKLYVVGCNLSTQSPEVFCSESNPDMPLAIAIRISMSLPLFFKAVNYNQQIYVDGGTVWNYPIQIFDKESFIDMENEHYAAQGTEYYTRANEGKEGDHVKHVYNCQTLGFRLDSRAEIAHFRDDVPYPPQRITSWTDYATALVNTVTGTQDYAHMRSEDWHRTVYIDTLDVGTTDFNIPEQKKMMLLEQGIEGTSQYFRWFEHGETQPMNSVKNEKTEILGGTHALSERKKY